jgi:hypothetical protein
VKESFMRHSTYTPRAVAAAALLAALLAGCAAIKPAELALPAGLEGVAAEPIQGIGGGEKGRFNLGATAGRYERGANRLSVFGLFEHDRAAVQYTLDGDGTRGSCKLRGNTVTAGIVQLPTKPAGFDCDFARGDGTAAARLELRAVVNAGMSAGAGTRDERQGRLSAGPVALEVRSIHRVRGSPLPLSAPVGYEFMDGGRAVAALELTGPTPRLWRPADGPLREPVTQAALALALLWDPAGSEP